MGVLAAQAADESASPLSLNREQQAAVGLRIARPQRASAPERLNVLGLVLDPAALVADAGDLSVTTAAEKSSSAELARLHELYQGGAGASLKAFQAAQADQARLQAEKEAAAARFAQRWGPLAELAPAARQRVIDAAASGTSLLVRAELSGSHSVGELPTGAILNVDGVQVAARVLGALRQFSELQSAGLLLEVSHPPKGLGAGARVPLELLRANRSGFVLPREALFYDENGVYVYKQLTQEKAAQIFRYAAQKVRLLLPYGDGWLVQGVDSDDDIVVHGAGVLWSLKTGGAQAADDDD
jgi:hypothetical protein